MNLLQRLSLALWLTALAPAVCAIAPAAVHAQDHAGSEGGDANDGKEDAAESRSAAFQAVTGGKKEDVPGGPLLLAAYGVILALLVAYVARLGALHAKNRSELDRLAQVLERGRKG